MNIFINNKKLKSCFEDRVAVKKKQLDLPGEREYLIVVVFEFLYFLAGGRKQNGQR
jgi:hypothetical protein